MAVIELYWDPQGKFRFRILDDDGMVVAVSVPYEDKASAVAAVRTARDCAATSRVIDLCGSRPEDLSVGEGGHFLG